MRVLAVGVALSAGFAGTLLAKRLPSGIALGAGAAGGLLSVIYTFHRMDAVDRAIAFPFDPGLDEVG